MPSKVNRDTSERKIPPRFIHRKNDDNATTGRWPSHHHNQRKNLTISVRQQRQINSLGNLPKFYAILRGIAGWRDFATTSAPGMNSLRYGIGLVNQPQA